MHGENRSALVRGSSRPRHICDMLRKGQIMTGRVDSYLEDTARITDVSELMGYFDNFVCSYGFDAVLYAVLFEELQLVKPEVGIVYHTYPPELMEEYLDNNYFELDPVIQAAPMVSRPFYWSQIERYVTLTDAQKDYLRSIMRYGLVEGLAVPVFNSKGNVAYFSFGSHEKALGLSAAQLTELQFISHQTHLRYLELEGTRRPEIIVLSPREKEVLYWIAQGKSNSVIASILDISDHTVDTLVRRCFHKLGVSNRVTAALKGVCAGLITA